MSAALVLLRSSFMGDFSSRINNLPRSPLICPMISISLCLLSKLIHISVENEVMRCAYLGFPRALRASGSRQGKCRFETPALLQPHTHTHTHLTSAVIRKNIGLRITLRWGKKATEI
jgi:hypothetical protein